MDERQDGGLEPPMEYIALARASELSGVSPATLSRQARMGKLRAVMKGHTLLTTRAWLHGYLVSRESHQGPRKPLPPGYVPPDE